MCLFVFSLFHCRCCPQVNFLILESNDDPLGWWKSSSFERKSFIFGLAFLRSHSFLSLFPSFSTFPVLLYPYSYRRSKDGEWRRDRWHWSYTINRPTYINSATILQQIWTAGSFLASFSFFRWISTNPVSGSVSKPILIYGSKRKM